MFYVKLKKYFSSQGYSLSRYFKPKLNIPNMNMKRKMAHSLHHQNIKTLEIEMLKIHHGFSQVSFLDLFHNHNERNFYSLRSQPDKIKVCTIFGTSNFEEYPY